MGSSQPVTKPSENLFDRRRSPRLSASSSVRLAWHSDDGDYSRIEAETLDISAHGALLRMDREMPSRAIVVLNHGPATNWAMARVMRSGPPQPEGWRPVAVELAVPSESFWAALGWAAVASSDDAKPS